MSGQYRLADRIAHAMLDRQFGNEISFGDDLLSECVLDHRCKGRMTKHPFDRMTYALHALDRAPDLFVKRREYGVDTSNRSHIVRTFTLVGIPRPKPMPERVIHGIFFTAAAIDRFWSKVDKSGATGCWIWTGHQNKHYGVFKYAGKYMLPHRVSLMMATPDENSSGLMALHSCQTPLCVNPAHLRWGTHQENTEDAIRDGSYKNRRKTPRLTPDKIAEILDTPGAAMTVAKKFNVRHETISEIRKRASK